MELIIYEGKMIIWKKSQALQLIISNCSRESMYHVRILPETPITTFDIRMTSPNEEPVLNTAEIHTLEHLGATFSETIREYKEKILYFGPMGCRTGFYLLLAGDYRISREHRSFDHGHVYMDVRI